ncbi:hypothetical protein [Streptomyces lunaelactis]|uniref:hypothetical protein n=1 Tax=Streptomyces lunaelactis TaxID=1535768 RepID=UPI0015848DAD|nr:hypothetical protein [Streptomyces lunaelactis]NUK18215.1 hypothetical protein [Streptomyces lunaelactis]
MERREYLGQTLIHATVLPARVVYLIREGSSDGFRSAVRTASGRWGGMTEPIAIVDSEGRVSQDSLDVVAAADLDGVVNVDVNSAHALEVAAQFGLPLVPLAEIGSHGIGQFTCRPSAVISAEPGQAAAVIAQGDAPLWQIAAAGDLDEQRLAATQRRVSVRRPVSDVEIGQGQLWGTTFLNRGMSQFGEHSVTNAVPYGGPAVVVVTEPDSLIDCLWFWNTRALRAQTLCPTPMLLMPPDGARNWVRFERQLADHALERREAQMHPDAVFVSSSVPDSTVHETAETLGLVPAPDAGIQVRLGGRRDPQVPYTYLLNCELRHLFQFERAWGWTSQIDAHLFSGESTVDFSSPVQFQRGGQALVRLSSDAFDGLPRRQAVADMIATHVVDGVEWHGDSLQIQSEALDRYRFTLTIPDLALVGRRLLDSATGRWEPSDKGRLGSAIAAQADISALLEPHIFEALVGLKTPRTEHFVKQVSKQHLDGAAKRELLELATEWGGRMERVYKTPTNTIPGRGAADATPALELACAQGWAERGLATSCGACKVSSFIPLSTTAGAPTCPGCSIPVGYSRENGKAIALHYRLNSFIDRACDLGVLPHLMVIAELTRQDQRSHFLPGANLWFDDRQQEVDVYGVWAGRVLAGEVKTKASEFDQAQTERDIELSSKLGADIHLMAATDIVQPETRAHAKALCGQRGLELLVLDQEQLRPGFAATTSSATKRERAKPRQS